MQLQTVEVDGKTYALVQEGKPLYKAEDGKDVAFDAPGTVATISRLNGEAKGHRERAEKAEGSLKAFEGLDPAAARDALAKIANIDAKKLIDAGEVDKVKAEAIKAVEEQYRPVLEERDALRGQLNNHIKGGAFANSKYVADKVAVPRHMLEKTYGDNFKVEDGKLIPYDAAGNKLFSRARPGEVADFEEAIELLIAADPFKDHILKGVTQPGGGAGQGGNGQGGAKTMSRAEFGKLAPAEQMAKVREGFAVTD